MLQCRVAEKSVRQTSSGPYQGTLGITSQKDGHRKKEEASDLQERNRESETEQKNALSKPAKGKTVQTTRREKGAAPGPALREKPFLVPLLATKKKSPLVRELIISPGKGESVHVDPQELLPSDDET